MKWRLAKSLEQLRKQINAAYPNRSKVSDGTIGDAAHASRDSDHNPWFSVNGIGVVSAMDITHDPENVDGDVLSELLIKDPRTKYVIWNGRIWKERTGQWEVYRGPNRHEKHVHLSVQRLRSDDADDWNLDGEAITLELKPTLKRGDRGQAVAYLQCKLGIDDDGKFGPATLKAVREFQQKHGLKVDGIVGKATWAKLDEEK